MDKEDPPQLKAAISSVGPKRHGKYYSFLKCLEYACVVDISLKVMSIFMPALGYLKDHRLYQADSCHKLLAGIRILTFGLKAWSVAISVIGILAAINYNYEKMVTFRRHMTMYCLAELANLMLVVTIIATNSCTNYSAGQRVAYVLMVSIGGIAFLVIYYLVWMFVSDKCMGYLQNGREEIRSDEMPHSFNGYDTIEKRKDTPWPKETEGRDETSLEYGLTPEEYNNKGRSEPPRSDLPLALDKLPRRSIRTPNK